MSVEKQYVLDALFQKNYFPSQKRAREEMPPILSTETFTVDVAKLIHVEKRRSSKNYSGYDQVEYKATKFNNVPRYFAIPHPKPYVDLCFNISSFWRLINPNLQSENSVIKPLKHNDGRLIIMDYEQSHTRAIRRLEMYFGKKFIVKTDVSSCFPSIYSHALPWALVGVERSKAMKSMKWKNKWFNRLDESVRWCKRNETQGVPVGPASSNLISEIILSAVDKEVSEKFVFERFIDDYTSYTDTYEDAEEFIRVISVELKKYNLHLNPNKTSIKTLPQTLNEDWLVELNAILPKSAEPKLVDLIGYLDRAVEIQARHIEGSVIKYAAKCIIRKSTGKRRMGVLKYLLLLSLHYPVLIPVIHGLMSDVKTAYRKTYVVELNTILNDRVINQCSDGICWTLFYLLSINENISDEIANKIIDMEDCVSMLILSLFISHKPKVIKFCKKLKKNDLYTLDKYWLLLYQLYHSGDLVNYYGSDKCFEIMNNNNVNFIKSLNDIGLFTVQQYVVRQRPFIASGQGYYE